MLASRSYAPRNYRKSTKPLEPCRLFSAADRPSPTWLVGRSPIRPCLKPDCLDASFLYMLFPRTTKTTGTLDH